MNRIASQDIYERLRLEVIEPGLCTHCGTCAGLSRGTLSMVDTPRGPLPQPGGTGPVDLPPAALEACPGKGLDYPALSAGVFERQPENWLLGWYQSLYVGYARDEEIRRAGASGGVITRVLLHLLKQGHIDGAIVVRQGDPQPWQARSILATTEQEIRACAQSVYVPVPVNEILAEIETFEGRLAFVGTPDQVASLRCLQRSGHEGARKIDYVLGPYVGTLMYRGAIESYLRSNGVSSLEEIVELKYRAGEWPGHLRITTASGKILQAEKFYYNYLIPFYITQSSLLSVDFTNELTDISVGDAWHPRYEAVGKGFSVVVARSKKGDDLLRNMAEDELLHLDAATPEEVMSMHGHMLDFKKRGAFIRIDRRARAGRPVPDYGYRPERLAMSRKTVEWFLGLLFGVCGTRWARRVVEWIPLGIIGPVFNVLRKTWKNISKPTKRKGLGEVRFVLSPTRSRSDG